MSPLSLKRFSVIKTLSRYEAAYAKALKMAKAASPEEVVDISNIKFEIARMYKYKITELRKELKELN